MNISSALSFHPSFYRVVENQATREGIQRFVTEASEEFPPTPPSGSSSSATAPPTPKQATPCSSASMLSPSSTVFSQAWQTSSLLFLCGASLGYYLGALFFGEKHPLKPAERTAAANCYNETIARNLGVPPNLSVSPLLGPQRGLAISFPF